MGCRPFLHAVGILWDMVIAFAFALSVASASAPTLYVQADVVRIRAEPNEKAEIKAKLRINTPVTKVSERDGWTQFALAKPSVEGWAPNHLLGPGRVSVEALVQQSSSAALAERIAALERLVALEPNRAEHYRALAGAYKAAGLKGKAKLLQKRVQGAMPIFIAACQTKATVLARFISGGELEPLRPSISTEANAMPPEAYDETGELIPPTEELSKLVRELPSAFWTSVEPAAVAVPDATPFPVPRIASGTTGLYSESWWIELGGCDAEGYFVSAPVQRASLNKKQRALVGETFPDHAQNLPAVWFSPVFGKGELIGIIRFDDTAAGEAEESGDSRGYHLFVIPKRGEPTLTTIETSSTGC